MTFDSISNECVLLLNYQQLVIYIFALRVSQEMHLKYSPCDQY